MSRGFMPEKSVERGKNARQEGKRHVAATLRQSLRTRLTTAQFSRTRQPHDLRQRLQQLGSLHRLGDVAVHAGG